MSDFFWNFSKNSCRDSSRNSFGDFSWIFLGIYPGIIGVISSGATSGISPQIPSSISPATLSEILQLFFEEFSKEFPQNSSWNSFGVLPGNPWVFFISSVLCEKLHQGFLLEFLRGLTGKHFQKYSWTLFRDSVRNFSRHFFWYSFRFCSLCCWTYFSRNAFRD